MSKRRTELKKENLQEHLVNAKRDKRETSKLQNALGHRAKQRQVNSRTHWGHREKQNRDK